MSAEEMKPDAVPDAAPDAVPDTPGAPYAPRGAVRRGWRWGARSFFWTDDEAAYWITICERYDWETPSPSW